MNTHLKANDEDVRELLTLCQEAGLAVSRDGVQCKVIMPLLSDAPDRETFDRQNEKTYWLLEVPELCSVWIHQATDRQTCPCLLQSL